MGTNDNSTNLDYDFANKTLPSIAHSRFPRYHAVNQGFASGFLRERPRLMEMTLPCCSTATGHKAENFGQLAAYWP